MQVTGAPPSNGDFELTVVGLPVGEDNGNGGHYAGDGGSGQAACAATQEERYHPGNSSAAGAVANFVNTIVGAGIVGLPFALAQVREGGCGIQPLSVFRHISRSLAKNILPRHGPVYFVTGEDRTQSSVEKDRQLTRPLVARLAHLHVQSSNFRKFDLTEVVVQQQYAPCFPYPAQTASAERFNDTAHM